MNKENCNDFHLGKSRRWKSFFIAEFLIRINLYGGEMNLKAKTSPMVIVLKCCV